MSDQDMAAALLRMADLLQPHAIRVAATLDLAGHIDAGANTALTLADRTRSHRVMLGKLLRYLAELGVLEQLPGDTPAEPRYRVTGLGAPLRREHPFSAAQYLSATGLFGRAELGLVGLLDSVRTGTPAHVSAFGRDYWDDINTDPSFAAAIRVEGAQHIGWDAELVIDSYDWSTVTHVTDVGGNNGTLLIALLTAHPHLRGVVLDLANNAAVAGERIAAAGLADRGWALTGSFFDPLPTGSDVYLLSGILGDWYDADAIRILRRCREAAGDTGRVLLAEIKINMLVTDLQSAAFDLFVAATVPAPARTPAQLDALVEHSGLRVTWRGPETPVRSVIELATAPVPVGAA